MAGILGAAGLHAQSSSWQLSNPTTQDDEAFHGSDMLTTGQIIILGFSANGASGSLEIGEMYHDEGKVINGKAVDCPAAMVKTWFSWTFQSNATYLFANQKVNLTLQMQQDSSCHNVNSPYMIVAPNGNVTAYGPAEANNPENRYYYIAPAGVVQTNVKTIAITPANSFPTASFHIQLHCDNPIDVVYAYNEVATTPATEMVSWASKDPRFGAAVPGSFEIYPNWQAGWTLDSMVFEYQGGRQVTLFMAYQNSAPLTRWMLYVDPVTGQWTSWIPYNG